MNMNPKQYRKKHKLNLAQMAGLIGVSSAYISMLENGKRKPSADVAESYYIVTGKRVKLQDFPAMQGAM